MPSHFTLRMQFGLQQDPAWITDKVLRLVREAPVEEIILFYFAEELNDGHETSAQIVQWIEHSRPTRVALREAGIRVSLNPWHSVLHCDRGRRLKPGQDWQVMVDPDGCRTRACVCYLDAGWNKYYAETLRLYAAEGFDTIWIDDDIRFHNHEPLHWGSCFCPLHVAEFNRRAGTRATREEIVANCLAPGAPHPWRAQWLDMWEETLLARITSWQQIVAAEGCRLGLMFGLPETHGAEGRRWPDWWKAFGGDKARYRPHLWSYSDVPGTNLPHSIALMEQNRMLLPVEADSGPEIENFPYGQWNKSFRQTGAQMALSHILGSTHLNISLYDFMGNDPDDEPQRAEFLRRWRPVCDWLADEFPLNLRPVGIGIPWSPDMGRIVHTRGNGDWGELEYQPRGWARWLGGCGLAFTMRPALEVNALSGQLARCISDAELRDWLSRGMLLDGEAAMLLLERGLGELIGLRDGRFITQHEVLYSVEQTEEATFGLRAGAQMGINVGDYRALLFQGRLLNGAREISSLRGPRLQVVGHGVVLYQNILGGRVAIVPWSAQASPMLNIQRVTQLRKVLAYLAAGTPTGAVAGNAWLIPQFLTDGERRRGVIWNASLDAPRALQVTLPAGFTTPTVTQVTADGERLLARYAEGHISLQQPLQQWEFIVLKA